MATDLNNECVDERILGFHVYLNIGCCCNDSHNEMIMIMIMIKQLKLKWIFKQDKHISRYSTKEQFSAFLIYLVYFFTFNLFFRRFSSNNQLHNNHVIKVNIGWFTLSYNWKTETMHTTGRINSVNFNHSWISYT